MSEPFLGEIIMFGGNFAPRGWALCDGQLLPIAQYSALFSILGTTYGGDGRTTFALPDMRGRVPLHPGNGPGLSSYREGQKGGRETVTLNITEMPSHNHTATTTTTVNANRLPGTGTDPTGAFLAAPTSGEIYIKSTDPNFGAGTSTMDSASVSSATTVGNAGGNLGFDIRQPYLAVYFIIALQGIFPSRS